MGMFELPNLPYSFDALEPAIDAATMEIHHGKHHAGYVNNLNAALEGKEELAAKSVEELVGDLNSVPEEIRTAVRNNGGGLFNHSLFGEIMSPSAKATGDAPAEKLKEAIDRDLGGLVKFKEDFAKAAMGRFGSGWAWLVVDGGKLKVGSTPNQDNPLMKGVSEFLGTPILGLDVWEHAYYIQYKWERAKYVENWWKVVNWAKVGEKFAAA